MQRFLIVLFTLALSVTMFAEGPITLFQKGDGGYHTFRIPAMVRTDNGTIIAFAEARKDDSADGGRIDLVQRRSFDGGVTWGPVEVIWSDGANTCGNPSPVYDSKRGRLVLIANWNRFEDSEVDIRSGKSKDGRRIYVFFSSDEGASWTSPREITADVKRADWAWYATGPGHAIQLMKGPHKGRLVVPCNHSVLQPEGKLWHDEAHIIYSDDGGETWLIGGTTSLGNESTAVQLKNGDILLNSRVIGVSKDVSKGRRIAAISQDAGESFGESFYVDDLLEPRCQASIINYAKRGRLTKTLLFSNPKSQTRDNLCISLSKDSGKTWSTAYQVHSGPAAYSDLLILPNRDIAIIYEAGLPNHASPTPYDAIYFQIFKN